MIRVLIADDHPVVREGMRRVLERASDVQVIAELDSGERLVETVRTARPDVVLMDVSMPGPGHLELLRALKEALPQVRCLVVSAHDEAEYAIPALRAGAAGYLMKSGTELVEAVRRVYAGRRYISAEMGDLLAAGLDSDTALAPHLRLSARELEVLTLMAAGTSLKEIGGRLGINSKTVSSYRARILEKLDVRTNAELVRYAMQHDLIPR